MGTSNIYKKNEVQTAPDLVTDCLPIIKNFAVSLNEEHKIKLTKSQQLTLALGLKTAPQQTIKIMQQLTGLEVIKPQPLEIEQQDESIKVI